MFGTSGVRGTIGEEITADLTLSLGRALGSERSDLIVVGRDARTSGEMLEHAFIAGVTECGADVIRIGTNSTPTIARSAEWLGADASAAITASHNPPTDNGVKLWTSSGRAFGRDRRERIERRIRDEKYEFAAWNGIGSIQERDTYERHRQELRTSVDLETPLSVVVGIGNGTGRLTADVLADLGCTVSTLNGQRDGRFPSRPSEPTAEAIRPLRTHVEAVGADLGIAHDGDADRMIAVDGDGRVVAGDTLLSVFAREAAAEGDQIAVPVNTSLAVDDAVAAVGADVVRTRVGDTFVAERCAESNVVFGGEPSGAWIWSEETPCPDGTLAACKLVELVSRRGPLADLTDEIDGYPLRRGSLRTDHKRRVLDRIEAPLRAGYERIDDRDGIRVETDNGWFLIRASGTQPLVRVTAEARTDAEADRLFDEAMAIVEERADLASAPDRA
ncbi:phosphoglucosamine mutase [Halobellus salinisoli]|uniref:phosphoglucosamine mutase n=1 Tax=Halobellus salinisoli TaxID=3108500 RepID=UPI00300957AA